METKVEAENRVFPKSDSSKSVWDVLVKYMKSGGVTIFFNSPVDGFIKKDGKIESVLLKDGREIKARSFILATGGMSRPETGSTGEGLDWLSRIGHTVVKQGSALVPISVKDAWVKRLQGISLPNVKISIVQNGKKQVTQAGPLRRSQAQAGKILFTHYGLSGPAILNLSRDIGESLKYGDTHLSLDVLPNFDYAQLDSRLKEILKSESNKKFKNSLGKLLPAALSPVMVEISGINPEVFCRSVKRDERIAFGKLLKNIPLEVKGLLGADKAIVTSGGVALTEIDFKTMSSRFFPNLYLVGDILNINRPSGVTVSSFAGQLEESRERRPVRLVSNNDLDVLPYWAIKSAKTTKLMSNRAPKEKLRLFRLQQAQGSHNPLPANGRKDIRQSVPLKNVFPVGRRDKVSHGLIILTDDGRATDRLLNPKYAHDKEYVVSATNKISPSFKNKLESGVNIGDYKTKKCKVAGLSSHVFKIILTEGKKHQIRRMCSALKNGVTDLKRIRIMNIHLGNLGDGQYRKFPATSFKKFLKNIGL